MHRATDTECQLSTYLALPLPCVHPLHRAPEVEAQQVDKSENQKIKKIRGEVFTPYFLSLSLSLSLAPSLKSENQKIKKIRGEVFTPYYLSLFSSLSFSFSLFLFSSFFTVFIVFLLLLSFIQEQDVSLRRRASHTVKVIKRFANR